MSPAIPHFLLRLDLAQDADARAIKRAYARELKLIDQEHDLPGFQALREAYEASLAWAARQLAPRAPAPAGDAPYLTLAPEAATPAPAPVAPTMAPQPHALAELVFARFADNARQIVAEAAALGPAANIRAAAHASARGRRSAPRPTQDQVAPWVAELEQRLADDELLSIAARGLFETRVAMLLWDDWSPHAIHVFDAASQVFGWADDRRRLQQLGRSGAWLDRAIDERTMFLAQDMVELARQRKVIERLRQPQPPSVLQINRDHDCVQRLLKRFPNFMAVMVDSNMVEQWSMLSKSEWPAEAQGVADASPEPSFAGQPAPRRFDGAWIFFVVLALVYGAIAIGNRAPQWSAAHKARPAAQADDNTGPSYAPGADPSAPDYVAPRSRAKPGRAIDPKLIDVIAQDIKYTPPAKASEGELRVEFEVLLGSNGKPFGVSVVHRSGDLKFDKAAEEAVLRAKPFPPNSVQNVRMSFGYRWKRGRPPRPPLTPEQRDEVAKVVAEQDKLPETPLPAE